MLSDSHNKEIQEARNSHNVTKRATVKAMEDIMYNPIPCLDWGFVRVVDYMGDDSAIVQAARVSYGKGTKKVNEDAGLINYLMRNRHTSPMEMCEIKLHIKLPIFVMRQLIRHRTANVNEYSARYSILAKEFYVPTIDNLAPQSKTNHQGRGSMPLSSAESARVLELLRRDAEQCYDSYQEMINEDNDGNKIDEERDGLARELARMNLNLNYYTECYWKIDLHNLLHFLGLRVDHHAQYEIQVYAKEIMNIVEQWTPLAHAAFVEHRMNGVSLSAKAFQYIRARLNDEMPSREESGMSKTEWNDIHNQFKLETRNE